MRTIISGSLAAVLLVGCATGGGTAYGGWYTKDGQESWCYSMQAQAFFTWPDGRCDARARERGWVKVRGMTLDEVFCASNPRSKACSPEEVSRLYPRGLP